MRNIIYLLLALIIGVVIFFALKKNSSEKKEDNTASDYQKIETVKKALDELFEAVKNINNKFQH